MPDRLRHEALPYRGHEQFVVSSVSVLRDGLDRDERLIFLAPAAKVDDVRDALGPDCSDVMLVATDEHGRNPSRITTMLHSFQAMDGGRRALGVNETIHAGLAPAMLCEAQIAESVLNASALASWAMSIICLYDVGELDADCRLEMRRDHPVIRGEAVVNDDYDSDRLAGLYATDLTPPPPQDAIRLEVHGLTLTTMRDFVRAMAVGYGVRPDRVDDLVLAANEIVTNSLRHGGGGCELAMWRAGDAAVCEVRDGGHIRDALVGRLAPEPDAVSGRGLWLANHLCDLLQIRSSEDGTVVRLAVER
jgi:anti-sigma regulatory factor (Ser/Thr protein kinase)